MLKRIIREFKEAFSDPQLTDRSNPMTAYQFLVKFPAIAFLLGVFLFIAGLASVGGYLRADNDFFRWAGACVFWLFSALAFVCSSRGFRTKQP